VIGVENQRSDLPKGKLGSSWRLIRDSIYGSVVMGLLVIDWVQKL